MMRRRGAKLEHNTSGNGSASGDLLLHRRRTFAVSLSSAIIIVVPSRLLQVHAVTIASVGIDGSHNQHPRRVRRSRKKICFSGFEKIWRAIPLPGAGEGFFAPAAAENNVQEIIRLRPKKRHCRRRRCRRSQFVFLSGFEIWLAIEIPLKEKMVAPAAKVSVPSHWYRSLIIEPLSKFPLAA